ncbi:hypothetical protein PAXINDRAFT_158620 [Paxillus involutus ATCC 200175]|uniref:Uncharacterized protein n=1 Tax=Paxillus involutus ATCC 200175 TaxID=664439 RepID=A0A0C9SVT0_PAXIN|nr:hypothetical protein PAXINDRAFT_158620 [Paxillus involutus ATCC 200175]
MLSKLSLTKACSQYQLECRLTGHQDVILCLAISNSGKLLASGGFDSLRMWDLQGQIQLAKPSQMRNPRDPVTCAVWLMGKNNVQEMLCCGTGLGYLIIWKQRPNTTMEFDEILSRRIGSGQEIMHITCDTHDISGGTCFITGTRDKRVQVWSLDSRHQFSNVFSIELSTTVPRASFFHGTDIIICGMYDGEILRGKDGLILGTYTAGMMIGSAAMDPTHSFIVIDNIDGACIHMYNTKPEKAYPKQVALAERAGNVVGGGENGVVFVFNKNSGERVQTLRHAPAGHVQTIMTHDGADYHLIVAASSSSENHAKISVWKKRCTTPGEELKPTERQTMISLMWSILQTTSHLLTTAIVVLFAFQMMVNPAVLHSDSRSGSDAVPGARVGL